MRLDKYLADMSIGTRSQVKEIIKKGRVSINDVIVKKADYQVKDNDEVKLDNSLINYIDYEYYILNKPAGYLSATEDKYEKTIMELIVSKRKDLVPVGRLDKDTEGLILITNDGMMNHNLLSSKNHVEKTYYVEVDCDLPDNANDILSKPIEFKEFTSLPAKYEKISEKTCYLTITEGKFHQVKRMFEHIGCKVTYLKRIKFGSLTLEGLNIGEYRQLNNEEIEMLKR